MKEIYQARMGKIGMIVCIVSFIISFYVGITSCGPNPVFWHLNNPILAFSIMICGFSIVGLLTSALLISTKDSVI